MSPRSAFTSASGSATAHRMQLARMERAGVTLTLHPEAQAEAIARHYIALSTAARDLLALVESRDSFGGRPLEVDSAIAYLVVEIKRRHADDFGLPLEWPNHGLSDKCRITNAGTQKPTGGQDARAPGEEVK